MTTIADRIAARVAGADAAFRVAREAHETARSAALGPYPESRSDRAAWSDYLARERALPDETRAELDRLRDVGRAAKTTLADLRGDGARYSLADRVARDYLAHLPVWPVAQTDRARAAVIAAPLRTAIARWSPPSNLLLLGPTGTGKTTGAAHLVLAMLSTWLDADCAGEILDVRWLQATALERMRREHALGAGDPMPFWTARDSGLLVLDDLGQEPSRGETTIWDMIDGRYTRCLPTVVTSGLTRAELVTRYGEAFCRRLSQDGRAFVGEVTI